MKLKYIKITKTSYKFFYEEKGRYGEFYLEITPDHCYAPIAGGTAVLTMKDPDYAPDLLEGLSETLDPKN